MASLRRAFDYVVPLILSTYIGWCWYVVIFEVGVGWLLRRQHHWLAIPYLVVVPTLLFSLTCVYYSLVTLPSSHSIPPPQPPQALISRETSFECADDKGSLPVCLKGQCQGRWKAPRAHHCSTCETCRVGYDHHCPWIGNCVTIQNRPKFLLFLLLTSVAIPLAILPVFPTAYRHAHAAYQLALTDPDIQANWWDWKWSWIAYGGPIGRYVGGLAQGFRKLQAQQPLPSDSFLGSLIEEPSLRLFFSIIIGMVLGLFTSVLSVILLVNVCRGTTTVDGPQRKRLRIMGRAPLIWMPGSESSASEEGMAIDVLPSENPYDLGWKENVSILYRGMWDEPGRGVYSVPALNPNMLQRIRQVVLTHDADDPREGPSEAPIIDRKS